MVDIDTWILRHLVERAITLNDLAVELHTSLVRTYNVEFENQLKASGLLIQRMNSDSPELVREVLRQKLIELRNAGRVTSQVSQARATRGQVAWTKVPTGEPIDRGFWRGRAR